MKRFIITLAVSVLTACGGGSDTCTVEIYGDSQLYRPTLAIKPADRLSELTGHRIIDHSVIGQTYTEFASRLSTVVAHSEPGSIVVIELGGNDAFIPISDDGYEALVRQTLVAFPDRQIIFITFVPLDVIPDNIFWTEPVVSAIHGYNQRLLKIADQRGLTLVRWDLVPYAGWQTDTIDGVHRTQAAMERLLGPLSDQISTMCN